MFLILAEEAQRRKLSFGRSASVVEEDDENQFEKSDTLSQATDSMSSGTLLPFIKQRSRKSQDRAMAAMEAELNRQEEILTVQRNRNTLNGPQRTVSAMAFRRFPSRAIESLYWAKIGREGLQANKSVYWPFLMALCCLFLVALVIDGSIYPRAMGLLAADLVFMSGYFRLSQRWAPPPLLDVLIVICYHMIGFTAMYLSPLSFFTGQATWIQVILTIISIFTARRLCVGRDADVPVSRGYGDGLGLRTQQSNPSRLVAGDDLLKAALFLLQLIRRLESVSDSSTLPIEGQVAHEQAAFAASKEPPAADQPKSIEAHEEEGLGGSQHYSTVELPSLPSSVRSSPPSPSWAQLQDVLSVSCRPRSLGSRG